jgi:O-antigen ligase
MPFFLVFITFSTNNKIRILAFLYLIPIFIACLLHYSRNAWISLLVSTFLSLSLIKKKLLAIGIIFVILLIIFLVPLFNSRLFSSLTADPSAWGDRLPMWKAAINIFKAYPIFGIGPGNYEKAIYQFLPISEFKEGLHHAHAHNMYLEILAELGIFGLLSFLFIFYIFFKEMIKKIKKNFDLINFGFIFMVTAVLIGELAASTIMVGVYNASLFWCLLGLAVGRME